MAVELVKAPKEGWDQKEMKYTCPYCGGVSKGKISDFTVVTDNPKYYNFEYTCSGCGNKVRF